MIPGQPVPSVEEIQQAINSKTMSAMVPLLLRLRDALKSGEVALVSKAQATDHAHAKDRVMKAMDRALFGRTDTVAAAIWEECDAAVNALIAVLESR